MRYIENSRCERIQFIRNIIVICYSVNRLYYIYTIITTFQEQEWLKMT